MQKGDLPLCDLFWGPSCFRGIIDHAKVICSNYVLEAHIEIHHNVQILELCSWLWCLLPYGVFPI
jgi:hypothetical protein